MNLEDLHDYLLAGNSHALSPQLRTWLTVSRRFAAFAEDSRSKIRKKLRASLEPESLLDVRLELETAYLLLNERPFSVVYEPPAAGAARAPDFAVSYTSHNTFMLEVTRLRGDVKLERLEHALCSKLGQLASERSNVLLVGVSSSLTNDTLQTAMADLQRRAERHDPEVLKRSRLRDWGSFFRHYGRLSEVLVRNPREAGALSVWMNPQAKRPLSSKIRTALYRSQRAV